MKKITVFLAVMFLHLIIGSSVFAKEVRYNYDPKGGGQTEGATGPYKVTEIYIGSGAVIVLNNQFYIDIDDSQIAAAIISSATIVIWTLDNLW